LDRRGEETSVMTTSIVDPGATRVRFRERQLLRAADLEAEQSYLITSRRRHNIGAHGWGIVSGLELAKTVDGIFVQPGLAIDGYGRELVVSTPVLVPPDAFTTLKRNKLDVWLFYDLVEMNVPQRGNWDCGPGRNLRKRERASLRITGAAKVSTNNGAEASRTPPEVPGSDLPFPPFRTPPDDPAREWPVYLGTIRRRKKRPINRKSPRPYASLTGEVVTTVSQTASIQVGNELASDSRRFAINIADADGKLIERMAVDRDGNTIINGNTTIRKRAEEAPGEDLKKRTAASDLPSGQLRLRENIDPNPAAETRDTEPLCARSGATATEEKPATARMLQFRSLATEPVAAQPWSIYRTSITQDKTTIRQLRFEIGHPGDKGDPKLSRLVVGTHSGTTNSFFPRVTVAADRTVTIDGNLDIRGELGQGPILADASDPGFAALVANEWVKGAVMGQVTASPAAFAATVEDAGETAIGGAVVDIQHIASGLRSRVVTNTKGESLNSGLAEGEHTLQVTAPGFEPNLQRITLAAGETKHLRITMRFPPTSSGIIQGFVTDSSGDLVEGATIDLRNTSTGKVISATTNDEGTFRFVGLTPGSYEITVKGAGFTPISKTVSPGETVRIVLSP